MNRKLLSLLLACLLLAMLLAGCTGGETGPASTTAATTTSAAATATTTTSTATATTAAPKAYYNEPGTLPIVDEPLTLTAGIPQSLVVEDYNTNEFTRHIAENSNISFDFKEYPANEYLTKIDLMMAAGGKDLPDVLFGIAFTTDVLVKWGQSGYILPLNEYLDNLAYHIVDAYNGCELINYQEALAKVTSYDGNIYGIPSYAESPGSCVTGGRIMIYREWLEHFNMEKPTTLDGLRAYLEAVRDEDPNGNGVKDELALTGHAGTVSLLKGAFITPFTGVNGYEYWANKDGTIQFNCGLDEYREGLRYIKALIDDGLLDPLMFTQEEAQMTALLTTEVRKVGAFVRSSSSNLVNEERVKFVFNSAFAGPDGVRYQTYNPLAVRATYLITEACQYPEAAFLLGDYIGSAENSFINNRGFEGKDWRRIDPSQGEINLYGVPDNVAYMLLNLNWGKLQNVWWANVGVSVLNSGWGYGASAKAQEGDPLYAFNADAAQIITSTIPLARPETVVAGLIHTEEETEVMTEIWAPIKIYIDECFTRFVLGDMNLDTEWESYLSTLNQMGLADCLDTVQDCYSRMFG